MCYNAPVTEEENTENGFDELMRLSQQFTRQEEERTQREKQRAEQRQKTRNVLQGLKEMRVSFAVEQLKAVAAPEIVDAVSDLKNRQDSDSLRKLISKLTDDIESRVEDAASSNPQMAELEHPVKTLNILMDLYFSLQ